MVDKKAQTTSAPTTKAVARRTSSPSNGGGDLEQKEKLLREAQIAAQARLARRNKPDVEPEPEPPAVSLGPVDKLVDLAFNSSRDKIREMTVISPQQAILLPQLDLNDLMWAHCIEVAAYRQDCVEYERTYKKKWPTPANLIEEFTYRTAQWQKSVHGKNMQSAIDVALAETETRSGDEEGATSGYGFEDDR